jgi:hypothetical protein
MAEALIAVVAALVTYWLKRKLNKEQDRGALLEEAFHEIDRAIKDGDMDFVNSHLERTLRRLSHRNGNRRQQGGGEVGEGETLHPKP